MATEAQILANRANAKRSTGPRTEAGKQASRLNALKSGLYSESLVIRGEHACDLDQLTAEYHREFHPVTPRERDLVDTLVRNEWIIRRMGLIEAELWGHHFQQTAATVPSSRFEVLDRNFPLGQAFTALSHDLERLQRRVSALERSSRRALEELTRLRRDRDALESSELPEPATPIGFVPSPVVEQAFELAMPAFEPPCPGHAAPLPYTGGAEACSVG